MLAQIWRDVLAARERDPAARSIIEIILCYSGLHAIILHRINHRLWVAGFRLWARFNSQVAKFLTGIEIHPGAKIGSGVFIDHGSGTVIGETAEVADGCSLFQGVTLGGTGKETGKRHPTLCQDVTVGAHAQVLGSFTIGRGSVIGAGAIVVDPVPEYCTVVGPKASIVRKRGKRVYDFRHDRIARDMDPFGNIEARLNRLEQHSGLGEYVPQVTCSVEDENEESDPVESADGAYLPPPTGCEQSRTQVLIEQWMQQRRRP